MFECELFDADAGNEYFGDRDLAVEPTVGLEFAGMRVIAILPDKETGSDFFLSVEIIATV